MKWIFIFAVANRLLFHSFDVRVCARSSKFYKSTIVIWFGLIQTKYSKPLFSAFAMVCLTLLWNAHLKLNRICCFFIYLLHFLLFLLMLLLPLYCASFFLSPSLVLISEFFMPIGRYLLTVICWRVCYYASDLPSSVKEKPNKKQSFSFPQTVTIAEDMENHCGASRIGLHAW